MSRPSTPITSIERECIKSYLRVREENDRVDREYEERYAREKADVKRDIDERVAKRKRDEMEPLLSRHAEERTRFGSYPYEEMERQVEERKQLLTRLEEEATSWFEGERNDRLASLDTEMEMKRKESRSKRRFIDQRISNSKRYLASMTPVVFHTSGSRKYSAEPYIVNGMRASPEDGSINAFEPGETSSFGGDNNNDDSLSSEKVAAGATSVSAPSPSAPALVQQPAPVRPNEVEPRPPVVMADARIQRLPSPIEDDSALLAVNGVEASPAMLADRQVRVQLLQPAPQPAIQPMQLPPPAQAPSVAMMPTQAPPQQLMATTNSPELGPRNLLGPFLQTISSVPAVWDFLYPRDMYKLRSISKATFSELEKVVYDRCDDGVGESGKHTSIALVRKTCTNLLCCFVEYPVPFPGYPGVLLTEADIKSGAGLFTHQLASLQAMHRAENANTAFGALRGGILGDAQGLGKTITMLALIASTSELRPVDSEDFYHNESIDEHWHILRTNTIFREEIIRALNPFLAASSYKELSLYVSPPYEDGKFPTVASFEKYVNKEMRPVATQTQLDLFRQNVIKFKAGLDRRNRHLLNNKRSQRIVFERSLIPCSTTLIIVPNALLEHWAEQIRRHVNLEVFADPNAGGGSRGVVYIDGVGDLSTAKFPLNHQQMGLPSAFHLLSHMIVVIPFSRIKQQYTHVQRRLWTKNDDAIDLTHDSETSSLLQVRWFRIVADEGHHLGGTEAESNELTKFINEMAAERRWVMSGTPTTGDEDSCKFNAKGLDQLQRLLLFLRHEKYGTLPETDGRKKTQRNEQQAKSAWDSDIKKPFLRKQQDGREKLYRVLGEVMVMHKKEVSVPWALLLY